MKSWQKLDVSYGIFPPILHAVVFGQILCPETTADLNKIEHWWFVLKKWIRQRLDEFDNFRDCVDAAFKYCPNVLA